MPSHGTVSTRTRHQGNALLSLAGDGQFLASGRRQEPEPAQPGAGKDPLPAVSPRRHPRLRGRHQVVAAAEGAREVARLIIPVGVIKS